MVKWDAEPLWRLFEKSGVDVRTMEPRPLEGPQRVEAAPEPTPTSLVTGGADPEKANTWRQVKAVLHEVKPWPRGRSRHYYKR
jgi:hypothetical protein